jgi:hypothetical protein
MVVQRLFESNTSFLGLDILLNLIDSIDSFVADHIRDFAL